MMRPTKLIKRTKPKTKPKAVVKPIAKAKVKIKPKFNLKGIPAKFKWISILASTHASSQTECDELLLAGVNAFETIHENETVENITKTDIQIVTQAMLLKKDSYLKID